MSRRGVAGPWPTWELLDSRVKLCEVRDSLKDLPDAVPDEIATYLSRFLVVRACGHMEFSLDTAISTVVKMRASPDVHNYIRLGLFKGRNPRPTRLIEAVTGFSQQWGAALKDKLDEDDGLLRREIEFLVDRRNKIAHGESEGIGRIKALALCEHALAVGDEIVRIMDPTPARDSPD